MTQEPIQNIIEERISETPYGATKTAELDIQFAIDPSYGLTRSRYGWYSNDVLFDSTFFIDRDGSIGIETGANGTDSARLRSAYPGRYVSHTLAEPGMGLQIPEQYLEYDTSGKGTTVSLTHGEISAEVVEWDDATDSGVNAHGLSFESDATYIQVRKGDQDTAFVPQKDWNIDPLDGTGPSGIVLRPEKGYVWNFPFTWYGQGALTVSIQDPRTGQMRPVHREIFEGDTTLGNPNLPVQVTIENKGTAQPLGANIGGMQFATHGAGNLDRAERGRETQITRRTGASYIDQSVTITNNEINPYATPGRPLIAARRDLTQLDSRVALGMEVANFYINSGGNLYIFIWDEYSPDTALTNENFRQSSAQLDTESRMQIDTQATAYTPSANAVVRGILFVSGDKNTAEVVTGEASSRLPLEAATIITAALPTGSNSTYAQPALLTMRESF